MTIFLRQSTASQEVLLGRFVDSADGNTEETGLTINNTDIKVWKTGATTLANKNSGGGTHIANGVYYAVLDATDTDTIGPLVLHVHVAGALYIKQDCCVLDEAVYDSLFGTVALSTLGGTAQTGDSFARIGATGSGLTSITGKTDNLPSDPADESLIIAATDALAGLINGLNDLSQADIRTAVGLGSANLDTQLDALPTANETRDAVFARAYSAAYGSFTFDEITKLMAAALLAKVSGMDTNAPAFRNLIDTANTIVATTDANGNRTAVTLTP